MASEEEEQSAKVSFRTTGNRCSKDIEEILSFLEENRDVDDPKDSFKFSTPNASGGARRCKNTSSYTATPDDGCYGLSSHIMGLRSVLSTDNKEKTDGILMPISVTVTIEKRLKNTEVDKEVLAHQLRTKFDYKIDLFLTMDRWHQILEVKHVYFTRLANKLGTVIENQETVLANHAVDHELLKQILDDDDDDGDEMPPLVNTGNNNDTGGEHEDGEHEYNNNEMLNPEAPSYEDDDNNEELNLVVQSYEDDGSDNKELNPDVPSYEDDDDDNDNDNDNNNEELNLDVSSYEDVDNGDDDDDEEDGNDNGGEEELNADVLPFEDDDNEPPPGICVENNNNNNNNNDVVDDEATEAGNPFYELDGLIPPPDDDEEDDSDTESIIDYMSGGVHDTSPVVMSNEEYANRLLDSLCGTPKARYNQKWTKPTAAANIKNELAPRNCVENNNNNNNNDVVDDEAEEAGNPFDELDCLPAASSTGNLVDIKNDDGDDDGLPAASSIALALTSADKKENGLDGGGQPHAKFKFGMKIRIIICLAMILGWAIGVGHHHYYYIGCRGTSNPGYHIDIIGSVGNSIYDPVDGTQQEASTVMRRQAPPPPVHHHDHHQHMLVDIQPRRLFDNYHDDNFIGPHFSSVSLPLENQQEPRVGYYPRYIGRSNPGYHINIERSDTTAPDATTVSGASLNATTVPGATLKTTVPGATLNTMTVPGATVVPGASRNTTTVTSNPGYHIDIIGSDPTVPDASDPTVLDASDPTVPDASDPTVPVATVGAVATVPGATSTMNYYTIAAVLLWVVVIIMMIIAVYHKLGDQQTLLEQDEEEDDTDTGGSEQQQQQQQEDTGGEGTMGDPDPSSLAADIVDELAFGR